jgi:hypothetical protein
VQRRLRGGRESWSSWIDGLILHVRVSKSREKRGGGRVFTLLEALIELCVCCYEVIGKGWRGIVGRY